MFDSFIFKKRKHKSTIFFTFDLEKYAFLYSFGYENLYSFIRVSKKYIFMHKPKITVQNKNRETISLL